MSLPELLKNIRKSLGASHGFTLIELLVVIAIIGLIISFTTASWLNAQQKARDGQRKSNIKSLQQALEIYFQQNGKYPSATAGSLVCNITGDSGTRAWGTEFFCDENGGAAPAKVTYMTKLPLDPLNSSVNIYCYINPSSFTYTLYANLENNKDPEYNGAAFLPTCGGGQTFNYSVTNP